MTVLIRAIERYESALPTGDQELRDAESALCRMLAEAMGDEHIAVCESFAEGCTEGFSHEGTIYAPGFSSCGAPCVIVIRRVRDARHSRPLPIGAGRLGLFR